MIIFTVDFADILTERESITCLSGRVRDSSFSEDDLKDTTSRPTIRESPLADWQTRHICGMKQQSFSGTKILFNLKPTIE